MTPDGMRKMTEKTKKAEDKPNSKNNKLTVSIPKYEIQTQRINKQPFRMSMQNFNSSAKRNPITKAVSTDANWGRLPPGYQPPQTKKENVAIESLRGYFTTKISDANKET